MITDSRPVQLSGKPLAIDLGMHIGADTDYYLARGYRVVAVEPNPWLISEVTERLGDRIAVGDLTIVNAALSDSEGTAPFHITENPEFSTLESWRAERCGVSETITVETTTLQSILSRFGDPDFIKCDIEGADGVFCEQLGRIARPPALVSVEGVSIEWLALLFAAGYDRFKLSNQAWVRRERPTIEFTLDGEPRSWTFGPDSSGPFGDDLPGAWIDFEEAARRWIDYERIKRSDPKMVLDNWFDFHAALRS